MRYRTRKFEDFFKHNYSNRIPGIKKRRETLTFQQHKVAKSSTMKLLSIISFALTTLTYAQNTCNCPENWTSFNGFCYYYDEAKRGSMTDSLNYCRSLDPESNLVTFHDESTMFSLLDHLQISRRIWLGLTQIPGLGYQWTDSSPLDYENWGPSHPNGDDCALIDWRGKWASSGCDKPRRFVCEKSCLQRMIVESFSIESTSELLVLAGFDGDKFLEHGCWCPNVASELELTKAEPVRRGTPIDFVDEKCRSWSRCDRCSTDFCDHDQFSGPKSNATSRGGYNVQVDYTTGNVECDLDSNSACQHRKCECDVRLVQDLLKKEDIVADVDQFIGVKVDLDMGDCRKNTVLNKQAKIEHDRIDSFMRSQSLDSSFGKVVDSTQCCYAGEGLWELYHSVVSECHNGSVRDLAL